MTMAHIMSIFAARCKARFVRMQGASERQYACIGFCEQRSKRQNELQPEGIWPIFAITLSLLENSESSLGFLVASRAYKNWPRSRDKAYS